MMTRGTSPTGRALRDEADWLPSTIDDLAELIGLLDARHRRTEMCGMADWLVRKTKGWPDPTSSATRAKYRKMLRDLHSEFEPAVLEPPGDRGPVVESDLAPPSRHHPKRVPPRRADR